MSSNQLLSSPARADRLYDLLPVVHRLRDAQQGYPLRALLRVVAEQVNIVEDDIAQLYENWFIETCQDWVVPYIGNLIGYVPAFDANILGDVTSAQGQARDRILIPRAEVANTIRFRRRKGTVHLLEDLAGAMTGWPSRVTEFYRQLSVTQNINYVHLDRGYTVDVRDGDALENIDTAFNELARNVDVRRVNSRYFPGSSNISDVGVYLWRLRAYSVTLTPAYCYEQQSPNCYLFSTLGNDSPLFTHPHETNGQQPTELDLPVPIRRSSFETQEVPLKPGTMTSGVPFYYGPGKSLQIWTGSKDSLKPVPPELIVPADLSNWTYVPDSKDVAVDPVRGRIVFPAGQTRKVPVWVSYYYGFSADMGGGEYTRKLSQPPGAKIYFVNDTPGQTRINDALTAWQNDAPVHAVIEIENSGEYVEPISISLKAGQTLQLRAANGARPVIRLLDWRSSQSDSLSVTGEAGSYFTIDGLLITGRGVQIEGSVSGVTIRHSTLVPGWGLHCNCEPANTHEPSLILINAPDCLTVQNSIIGAIDVERDEARQDPLAIHISDSILDATSPDRVALGADDRPCAHTSITILRSTVFGQLQSRELQLIDNSIVIGAMKICRRQQGCIRFSYVTPGSRTPRRYECQPDLVMSAVDALVAKGDITAADAVTLKQSEALRVIPDFNSTRYGSPTYCQLADSCAIEITTGAEDESEMGVFHNLFQAQRASALRARLAEYTPAGMDVGIFFAT